VRLDVVAHAVEDLAADVPAVDPGAFMIDPAVCEAARPPRLDSAATPQLREVIAVAMRAAVLEAPYSRDAAAALLQRVVAEPCTAAHVRMLLAGAQLLTTERHRQLSDAEQDAERCNDDRVRADVAIAVARRALTSRTLGAESSAKVESAEVAVARVAQCDLVADLESLRLEAARQADHFDEAIARGEAAVVGYAARGRIAAQLAVGLDLLDVRDVRARADDTSAVPRLYEAAHARATRELGDGHPMVRKIEGAIATRMFVHGDVSGAHIRFEKLWRPVPRDHTRRIRGRVLGRRGLPVEGATIVAGRILSGDTISAAAPLPWGGGSPLLWLAGDQRRATTSRTGEFEIPDAPPEGVVIAQLGDERSRPVELAETVTLTLESTSRLEGHIDLRGEPAPRVLISVRDSRLPVPMQYELLAPVKPDGTFAINGVPRAQVRVFAVLRSPRTLNFASVVVDARAPVVRGVSIAVARSKRVVHVIVRSTAEAPVGNALVYVFPGQHASARALDMSRKLPSSGGLQSLALSIEGGHAPPAVVERAHAGDRFATMNGVPEGVATACATSLPSDLSGGDDLSRKLSANLAKFEIRCKPIPTGAAIVEIEIPPSPRLD
jgi:hypothetical protein